MNIKNELEPQLARQLDLLREQPERDAQAAARGRSVFLARAQEMASESKEAATPARNQRPNMWTAAVQSFLLIQRNERSHLFGALSTIMLVVSLALAGSGITLAAAQQSLPDDRLYPVKTWSEDVRVRLTENEESRLLLALDLANRRAAEMQRLMLAGRVPPETLQSRWQTELHQAVQLAAGKPDEEAVQALKRIREQVQNQEQALMGISVPPANQLLAAVLERSRTMLRDQLRLCEEGIRDPSALRQLLKNQVHENDGFSPNDFTPPLQRTRTAPAESGNGSELPNRRTATADGSANPWTTGTPAPGSGYGPGTGSNTQDPQGGSNPWTEGTPTPGSSYGPGPGGGGSGLDGGEGQGPNPGTDPGGGSGPGQGEPNGDGAGTGTEGGGGPGESSEADENGRGGK